MTMRTAKTPISTESRQFKGGDGMTWIRVSAKYTGDECLIWPMNRPRGYPMVMCDGKLRYAHRVMCELVNGQPPTPTHEAAHSCGRGNQGCMTPRHLSWKTRSENQAERRSHGTHGKGMPGRRYKLTAETAAEIRTKIGTMTNDALAAQYGVTRSNIRQIELGKIWPADRKPVRFFTDEEIAAIRAAKGIKTQSDLAIDYGTTRSAIGRIQRGEDFCRASTVLLSISGECQSNDGEKK